MKKINALTLNEQLEKELKLVNEELNNKKYCPERYHELLFLKARIYIIKFMNTEPVENKLYFQAQELFATANNAYLALHNKLNPEYCQAYNTAQIKYTYLNLKY